MKPCFLWSKLVVVVIHKNPGLKQIKTKQWNFAQKNTNIYLREKYKYLFEGKIGGNSWWGGGGGVKGTLRTHFKANINKVVIMSDQ